VTIGQVMAPSTPFIRPHVVARVRAALAAGQLPTALDVADAILRTHGMQPFRAVGSRS
jgi:hypothetical protein